MKTIPVASPHAVAPTQQNPQKAADARARAVAKMSAGPISVDQNNISPEEVSAVRPHKIEAQPDQIDTNSSVEDTPAPKAPEKTEETQLSTQMQMIVRRERALRAKAQKQQQDFQARQDQLKAKELELKAQEQQYKDGYVSKQTLKNQTLQALMDAGVTYEELTNQILNQPALDPRTESTINRLEAKIKSLEEANEQGKKAQVDQQTAQYQAAVKQIRQDVIGLVNSDPTFETIKATRSVSDVVELITKTYDEDGIVMSVEEAAQQVEDYLVEEATRLAKLSKIQKRLTPAAKPASQQTQGQKQSQPMKTLTNATSSTRQLSARERALLAFKGELKS